MNKHPLFSLLIPGREQFHTADVREFESNKPVSIKYVTHSQLVLWSSKLRNAEPAEVYFSYAHMLGFAINQLEPANDVNAQLIETEDGTQVLCVWVCCPLKGETGLAKGELPIRGFFIGMNEDSGYCDFWSHIYKDGAGGTMQAVLDNLRNLYYNGRWQNIFPNYKVTFHVQDVDSDYCPYTWERLSNSPEYADTFASHRLMPIMDFYDNPTMQEEILVIDQARTSNGVKS